MSYKERAREREIEKERKNKKHLSGKIQVEKHKNWKSWDTISGRVKTVAKKVTDVHKKTGAGLKIEIFGEQKS